MRRRRRIRSGGKEHPLVFDVKKEDGEIRVSGWSE